MGTSKSYSGSGGKAGKIVREDVSEWLDGLPKVGPADATSPTQPVPDLGRAFSNIVGLLRPRGGGGGDGPGGGGGGATGGGGRASGGPARTAARSAATAGRAAAAAYAFRAGDAATLERLGLNYAELIALNNPLLVTRRIVEAVCGPRGDSTIDDSEQRLIAAEVTEWVVNQQAEGYEPTPQDIAEHAISNILIDTMLTEVGEVLGGTDNAVMAEDQLRDLVEAWVENHANVSIEGATEESFSQAIEAGIESLRNIVLGGADG